MGPNTVVVCDENWPLCNELLRAVGGVGARRFDTLNELFVSPPGQLSAAVFGWSPGLRREVESKQAQQMLRETLSGVPAVLVLDALPSRTLGILGLTHLLPRLWVLISGMDSLESCLPRILSCGDRTGYQDIYEAVAAMLGSELEPVAAAAAIAGGRRRSVEEFASLCGISSRALELRLRAAGGPVPRELLGWVLSLHVLWRLDILGWQPKHVADSVSFRSVDAMALYVKRWTGERPRRILGKGGGFDGLVKECDARFLDR